jgi:hypothetical protein
VKKYPDITELLKHKEAHRRALAALPFEQKIELVFQLRARREHIKQVRRPSRAPKSPVKNSR